jgi:hypothetical protein
LLLLAASALVGCAGASSGDDETIPSSNRPSTPAQLRFPRPAPGAIEPPNFTLALERTGARFTSATSGAITRDEGHIHVSLHGRLVSMTYGTKQDLTGLAPGQHSLHAEFVAKDHAPSANRPRTFVSFTVQ